MRCKQSGSVARPMELKAIICLFSLLTLSTFARASPPSTQPSSQPVAGTVELRIYRPKYVSASRLTEIITRTFVDPTKVLPQASSDAREYGFVRSVVAEPQSNSVIVAADSVAHDNINRIVDFLATPTDLRTEVRFFEVRAPEEAKGAADLLNALFEEDTGAAHADAAPRSLFHVTADPGGTTLVVVADGGQMKIAEQVVAKVVAADEEKEFQVISVHVNHVSAKRAADMLRDLFSSETPGRVSRSPRQPLDQTVRAVGDEDRKIVILAGAKPWVQRAEQALKEMDVAPDQSSTKPSPASKN